MIQNFFHAHTAAAITTYPLTHPAGGVKNLLLTARSAANPLPLNLIFLAGLFLKLTPGGKTNKSPSLFLFFNHDTIFMFLANLCELGLGFNGAVERTCPHTIPNTLIAKVAHLNIGGNAAIL